MTKNFYKLYEYILVEVISEAVPTRFGGTSYVVKRKGTDQKGILICQRPLSQGDEVLCNVGDSDENGDNMVLIIHDHIVFDKFRNAKVSAADLQRLNDDQDVRYGAFREKLERLELEGD